MENIKRLVGTGVTADDLEQEENEQEEEEEGGCDVENYDAADEGDDYNEHLDRIEREEQQAKELERARAEKLWELLDQKYPRGWKRRHQKRN